MGNNFLPSDLSGMLRMLLVVRTGRDERVKCIHSQFVGNHQEAVNLAREIQAQNPRLELFAEFKPSAEYISNATLCG